MQPWKGVVPAGVAGALLALIGCADLDPPGRAADDEPPGAAEGGDEALGEGSAEATATGRCLVTGCSRQLCAEKPTTTTCEWREAYACYASYGVCERDAAGQCGWRPTPELAACLRARR
ncbi:hypothetical protein BE15_35570 [Sorangium cellulosum]|uniref:Uncharacterized protein n=2 Tax=Sorangium cellulosum TaxID=56 RepID=A0A150QUA6_SORCE|nr:hypothetical protein BE15_35570 [Sorangium cellulosum]